MPIYWKIIFFSLGICPVGMISLMRPISTYSDEEQWTRAQNDFNDRRFTFNYAYTYIKKVDGQIDTDNCLVFNLHNLVLMHQSVAGFPRAFKKVSLPHGSTSNIVDGQLINGVVVPSTFIRSDGKLEYAINSSFLTRADNIFFNTWERIGNKSFAYKSL